MKIKNINIAILIVLSSFCCYGQNRPIVNALSSYQAAAGEKITINGTNFIANSQVNFGAGKATFTLISSTLMEVVVPNTATYDPVTITNLDNGLKGSSVRSFLMSFGGDAIDDNRFDAQDIFIPSLGENQTQMWDVCLCDMNQNGSLDAAATHRETSGLTIFKNNSTPNLVNFNTPLTIGGLTNPIALGDKGNIVICEDIDGDGKSDLLVSSSGSEFFNVKIFKNTTTSTAIAFELAQSIQLPKSNVDGSLANRSADRIELTDMDLDGKKDLIIGVSNNSTIFIYKNESIYINESSSTIAFNTTEPFKLANSEVGSFDHVATGNMNNDGLPDLIIASLDLSSFYIYPNASNTNNFKFGTPVKIEDLISRENIRIGDFDNDGLDDFAYVSRTNDQVVVYRNTTISGNIGMTKSGNLPPLKALGIDLGDLDGDGLVDLVATSQSSGLRLYTNTSTTGNISFGTPLSIALNLKPAPSSIQKVARNIKIADINGDAKPDLVFTFNSASGEIGEFSVIANRNCLTPKISPQALSFCYDTPISLSASKSPGSDYLWSTNVGGATFDNNTLADVQLTVPAGSPASINVQLTITSSDGNCSDITSATYSLIGGSVPAKPTIDLSSAIICSGDDFTLSTTFTGGDYLWTRPDGSEATTSTINISEANGSHAGQYTLRVRPSGGCYSDKQVTFLDIDIPPTAAIFNDNATDDFCDGETIVLSVPDFGAYSQEWFRDNLSLGVTTPTLNVTESGAYRVDIISDANNCITSSDSYQVNAVAAPSAMITADTEKCVGNNIDFSASSTGATGFPLTHTWDFKDGSPVANGANVSHSFNATGTYLVELTSAYTDIEMCDDIITVSVEISAAPSAIMPTAPGRSFETDGFTLLKCPSDSVRLELPQNYESYKWSNGSTTFFTYAKTAANGDAEDITAVVVTDIGCTVTTETVTIANFAGSGIDITPAQFQIINNTLTLDAITRSISLTASTIGGSEYRWRANDLNILNDTANATVIVTPREAETLVTVSANDTNGCSESRSITIVKPGLQAAKAFSPDGDGINDCWEIINSDMASDCEIHIFDAKGSIIYEASSPFVTNCVWNGQLNGAGSNAPSGIYYFVLKCDKKSSNLSGSLLLVR